ncbi:MAG TPA: SUMF1/EgtB/PvdO family nonheme iron enzyme, partial [Anaerolineae bacterium]|nr:SUMF1/EgtB/PvdO family nonheme iron enzyme [Anaerolineae bacterium]
DIATAIGQRMGNTLFLASVAAAISVPLAIFLGLLAVRFRDRWPDKMISAITLTSISLPEFLLGYVLMYVFSVQLGWFPSVSNINSGMSLWQKLNAVALPGCPGPIPKPKAPEAGATKPLGGTGITLVYVPAGTYWMGAADSDPEAFSEEKPRHQVELDGYWLGQTEVTNAQYRQFIEAGATARGRTGAMRGGSGWRATT